MQYRQEDGALDGGGSNSRSTLSATAVHTSADGSSAASNANGFTAAESAITAAPRMISILEGLLEDMGVTAYDERVVQQLMDVLQRETLGLLESSAELAELRVPKRVDAYHSHPIVIDTQDTKLAIYEYMQKYVVVPHSPPDPKQADGYSNLPGRGHHADEDTSKTAGGGVSFPISKFPSSLPPYLPEDANVNLLVPGWDLKVDRTEDRQSDALL